MLLLDLELPGLSGVEVARRIRQGGSAARVLVLSAHDDEAHILGLLEHGAAGYLSKAEAPGSIVDAVRGVARGETGWFSQSVAATVARAAQERAWSTRADKLFTLTPRERQVLVLLARGHDNPRIAGELSVREGTVKNHITIIYDKLEVHSRTEAGAWAWRHGLVDDVDGGKT